MSDAIEQLTDSPLTARSTEITLTPAALADLTAGATASESTGLIIITFAPFETKSSMSLICFTTSSPASTTVKS